MYLGFKEIMMFPTHSLTVNIVYCGETEKYRAKVRISNLVYGWKVLRIIPPSSDGSLGLVQPVFPPKLV